MRIKRIEVIGFKSFCDRTVINITSPITSVVGPNGCGKSNIVDAIRWCMGEQSARHLRGKAMDDVIFAGSESRGPASMAEVSLTFEDVGFSQEALQMALDRVVDDEDLDPSDPARAGAGESAPTDPEGFLEWARTLPVPDVYDVIKDAEPLDDPVSFRYPASQRRQKS